MRLSLELEQLQSRVSLVELFASPLVFTAEGSESVVLKQSPISCDDGLEKLIAESGFADRCTYKRHVATVQRFKATLSSGKPPDILICHQHGIKEAELSQRVNLCTDRDLVQSDAALRNEEVYLLFENEDSSGAIVSCSELVPFFDQAKASALWPSLVMIFACNLD